MGTHPARSETYPSDVRKPTVAVTESVTGTVLDASGHPADIPKTCVLVVDEGCGRLMTERPGATDRSATVRAKVRFASCSPRTRLAVWRESTTASSLRVGEM